jgi:ABC-type uncharacterized transport system permease subunit
MIMLNTIIELTYLRIMCYMISFIMSGVSFKSEDSNCILNVCKIKFIYFYK